MMLLNAAVGQIHVERFGVKDVGAADVKVEHSMDLSMDCLREYHCESRRRSPTVTMTMMAIHSMSYSL